MKCATCQTLCAVFLRGTTRAVAVWDQNGIFFKDPPHDEGWTMQRECLVRAADGTQIYSSSQGEGPPLILCDGIGCDGFIWRYIRETFADRHTIIHWNYRGHGLSHRPKNIDDLDMAVLCDDLRAVMDAHDVDTAVLLGHSMGVQVILQFALTHPGRVQGLVPICGSYGRPLDTFRDNSYASKVFPILKKMVLKAPKIAKRVVQMACKSGLAYAIATRTDVNGRLIRPDDFKPYFEHLAAMDPEIFVRMLAYLAAHSVEERLGEINTPTLVMAGEQDTFTPSWLSHRMHHLIADAELLLVPTGTHVAPIEIPELVELRLNKFLSERVYSVGAQQAAPHSHRAPRAKRKHGAASRAATVAM